VQSRYVLCGEIGAGGMASVHLGRLVGSAAFARTVAIKRLLPRYAEQPEFRLMLIDEARLAARVHHPNVVQTLEVVANADELLLVMEYIDGVSLGRLFRSGVVPAPILAALVCQVLDGLHAAHIATDEDGAPLQIVHRDISPENILVGADGFARVLDFGIAKARSRLHETRDGAIKGKLAYMAPEQLAGKATQQSDVFASSIVLWEGLMGRRLFQADSDGEIIGLVLATVVEPPEGPLGEIAVRGLARAPAERWANARDMAEAIRAVITLATPAQIGAWVEATEPVWLAQRRALVRETEQTSLDVAPRLEVSTIGDFVPTVDDVRPPRRRRRVGGMIIGAALVLSVVAFAFSRGDHDAHDAPDARAPEPAIVVAPPVVVPAPPPKPAISRPAVTVPKQHAARPALHPSKACDPPYRLGPLGEKQWLKQCL
jgi:eukaryotic-like serine/threonine-protein kinase